MEILKWRLAGGSVLDSDPQERNRSLSTLIKSNILGESKTVEQKSSVNALVISLPKYLLNKCLFVILPENTFWVAIFKTI